MSLIDRAVKHFTALCESPQSIEVPEWADDEGPAIIYFTPLNMAERIDINKGDPDAYEKTIRIVMLKAKDKHNKPYFSLEDKPKLRRFVDPAILGRIGNEILNGSLSGLTSADIEKN